MMQQSSSTKGFIFCCYVMLLVDYLDRFPNTAMEKWEKDVGAITRDHWTEALESVCCCSLNVTQRLSQPYILLRVNRTPLNCLLWGSILTPCMQDVVKIMGISYIFCGNAQSFMGIGLVQCALLTVPFNWPYPLILNHVYLASWMMLYQMHILEKQYPGPYFKLVSLFCSIGL